MYKWQLILMALFLCAVGGAVQAQETPSPGATSAKSDEPEFSAERPGYAAGTGTVPPGHYQLELGYAYANGGGWQSRFLDGSQIRVPLKERFEARLGIPAYVTAHGDGESVSGFADISLSVKWRFLDDAPHRPSLALIVNTNLPTGRRDIGSHYFQPGSSLQAEYALSGQWGLTGSLTYANARDNDDRFDQFGISAGAGYAVSDVIGVFGEFYRFSKTGAEDGAANFFDGGATYLLNPRTQLDVSGGVGLSGAPKNAYFISAGIARRF